MKFIQIVLIGIILISFALVGAPIKYNCKELNIAIILAGIILVAYRIIKRKKIDIEKIDILTLMFYMSPIIPLVFGKYVNLDEMLMAIIRNISLFVVYLISKEMIKEKYENINIITSTIIIGGIVLVIFGIDEMTSKYVLKYIEAVNIPNVINHEHRMFSTIGYANSFAIIMAVEIMICLYKLKLKKEIYSGLIFIFLSSLLLTYSRSVVAIFAAVLIIYLIYERKSKIYSAYILLVNVILACIYMKLYEKFVFLNNYILIWAILFIGVFISVSIAKIISNRYERITRIKEKTYIKIAIGMVLITVITYFVGKVLVVPLQMFENEDASIIEVRRDILKVEKNKEYIFTFDIEAKARTSKNENYSITITEEDKYYDIINVHELNFDTFRGKKELKFISSNQVVKMVVHFNSKEKVEQMGLKINSLDINGKKFPLNYLYLPPRLVERIQSFDLNQRSWQERLTFYKDSLKIIKNNLLFGTGVNGWIYNLEKVRSYYYQAIEVHSYLLQIFIENGIFSAILWIVMVGYASIEIIKKRKKIDELDIGFIVLTLHSLIDFNLSFYVIMIIWILLYSIVITSKGIE